MSYLTYLKHHGVLGQKWGVRRTEQQLSKGKSDTEKKSTTKRKIAISSALTLTAGSATYLTYKKIKNVKKMKLKDIEKNARVIQRGSEFAAEYMRKKGKILSNDTALAYGKAFVNGDLNILRDMWEMSDVIPMHK